MVDLEAMESRHMAACEVGRKLNYRSLDAGDHNILFASCSDVPELIDHVKKLESEISEAQDLIQVGWMGPYGIIPGGMNNDPVPHWRPIYMKKVK